MCIVFLPLVKPCSGIMCSDVHDFGRVYILVSKVFRKLTVDIGIFNILEEITINDVESLII